MARLTCKRGRIPGWEKGGKNTWIHSDRRKGSVLIKKHLIVEENRPEKMKWVVTRKEGFIRKTVGLYNKKPDAERGARDWMCKHPRG